MHAVIKHVACLRALAAYVGRFADETSSRSSFENGYFGKRPDYLFWQSGNAVRSIASQPGSDYGRHRQYYDDRSVYSDRSRRSGRRAGGGGDRIIYEERIG